MKTITIKLQLDELLACQDDMIITLSPANAAQTPAADAGLMLFGYMEELIAELKRNRRVRTAETYRTTLNSFTRFRQGSDLPMSAFNPQLARDYECWLMQQSIKPNTSSFYMRILRAVYNRALALTGMPNLRPFDKVYTGIARTTKRAVGVEVIRQMEQLDLNDDEQAAFARDMFMFSFYTQGMSFVDMAYLKTTDLVDGMLTYHRQKTRQPISISWMQSMQQIVERHPSVCKPYLLPIVRSTGGRERSQVRRCQYMVNQQLALLAKRLGLPQKITMYVARHSWASIAHSLDIPVEVISRGMGHNSEATTHIYLKEIDSGRLAEANSRVSGLLR